MTQPDFTVDIHQNKYLPEGGQDVNAVVTVTAVGTASHPPAAGANSAMQAAGLALRVRTPQRASIQFIKQVAPAVEDLTGRGTQSGPHAADYPTGAWGSGESRDYLLCVRVTPHAVGQPEMRAARVILVAASPSGPEVLAEGEVLAIWTHDKARSAQINELVGHYTGHAKVADVVDASSGTVRLKNKKKKAEDPG